MSCGVVSILSLQIQIAFKFYFALKITLELALSDFVARLVVVTVAVAGERNGQAGKSAVGSHSEKNELFTTRPLIVHPPPNSDKKRQNLFFDFQWRSRLFIQKKKFENF